MTNYSQSPCTKVARIWSIALLAGTLSAALFSGCTKSIPRQEKKLTGSRHDYQPSLSLRSVSLKIYEPNTMDWKDLGIGYDEANIRYNKAKLYLSIGLTEVVKDSEISAWIIAQAKIHEDNVFYFDELFDKFPDTKEIMESTEDPLGEMTGWTFEQVQEQMQYDDYNIKASIYLTNTEIADGTLKPMVTPGYDIMQEDEKHPSDVVLGWYIDSKNVVNRINLWQEVIKGVAAPIFAIDGRATNKPPLVITGVPDTTISETANRNNTNRIAITKFTIGKRYENTGNSELAITGQCLFFPYQGSAPLASGQPNPNAYARKFLRKDGCGANTQLDFEIASVSAAVVNSWVPVTADRYFCWLGSGIDYWANPNYSERDNYSYLITSGPAAGNYQSASGRKKLYFNTYEADGWPTSNKTLSPASINGVALGLKGKMGTYNEWYLYDPYNASQWVTSNAFYPYIGSYPRDLYNAPSKGGGFRLDASGVCQ